MSAVRLCSAPRGKPPRGAPLSPAHAYPVAGVTAGSETAAAPKVRTQVAYDGPEGSDLLRYEPYLTHFLPEITDIGNKTCSVKSGTPPHPPTSCAAGGDSWLPAGFRERMAPAAPAPAERTGPRAAHGLKTSPDGCGGGEPRGTASRLCRRTLLTVGAAPCPAPSVPLCCAAPHSRQADLSRRSCLQGLDEHYSSCWNGC